MFLLILPNRSICPVSAKTLHSTMFLLIPKIKIQNQLKYHFTFHDVSINTNMGGGQKMRIDSFTFHDVSINTAQRQLGSQHWRSLHSTMFLLIQFEGMTEEEAKATLHSTMFLLIQMSQHYSERSKKTLHSTMFLLIPVVYSSLQYRYNLTTFCQSCHFIIFILIFIFLDSSHF